MIEMVFPKSKGNSGLYYLFSSLYANDLIQITEISNLVSPLLNFVGIEQSLYGEFKPANLGVYDNTFQKLKEILQSYQFGLNGKF